jgi:hypothetical protein
MKIPSACKDLTKAMHFCICGGTTPHKEAMTVTARQLKITWMNVDPWADMAD